jgi:Pentapeptide repeats (8 copies)
MSEEPRKPSYWRAHLNPSTLKAHGRWLDRKRTGEGRIVLEDRDLHGAIGRPKLTAARLVRCDLSDGNLPMIGAREAELVECVFDRTQLEMGRFENALIEACSFVGAGLLITNWDKVTAKRTSWVDAYLSRSSWQHAVVDGGLFARARFWGAHAGGARFTDCDFRGAALGLDPEAPHLGDMQGAHFTRCDFRGADIAGLRVTGATFSHCKFAGTTGTPTVEGPVTIEAADLSDAGDGSRIVTAAELLALWRPA